VICVGNFTVGGAGKTPLAIHLAGRVERLGLEPVFLTRGYRGWIAGPHLVDPDHDRASDVGDEALLLAGHARTMVARRRDLGARAIEDLGGESSGSDGRGRVIIMDDGLQNPGIAKSLAIAVVDGGVGLGNGLVFPAGPLRAPLDFQFSLCDAIVVNRGAAGAGRESPETTRTLAGFTGPVLRADIAPAARAASQIAALAGHDVVAFAGIGRPEKFFDTLESIGARIVEAHRFPDHHPLSDHEAQNLLDRADARGCELVTTEKDWARLHGTGGAAGRLRDRAIALAIETRFTTEQENRLEVMLDVAIRTAGRAGT